MAKRLSGSANTGKKIMQNQNLFKYTYNGSEPLSDGKIVYKFDWSFDDYQSGYISIELSPEGKISQSSLMGCNNNQREFVSTLGAYKDSSLYSVFERMLQSQNIKFVGL